MPRKAKKQAVTVTARIADDHRRFSIRYSLGNALLRPTKDDCESPAAWVIFVGDIAVLGDDDRPIPSLCEAVDRPSGSPPTGVEV